MFLGFRSTKNSNNYKLLFLSNLHSSTILPTSPFLWRKMYPPPWRINGTRDPTMNNQNFLFLIFVTTNKGSNNKNIELQI